MLDGLRQFIAEKMRRYGIMAKPENARDWTSISSMGGRSRGSQAAPSRRRSVSGFGSAACRTDCVQDAGLTRPAVGALFERRGAARADRDGAIIGEKPEAAKFDRDWWHALRKKLGTAVAYEYFVRLPAGYDADADKRWPVIFYLHGSGGGEKMENVQKVAQDEVQQVVQMDVTRMAVAAVVGVAVIAGVAYFAGTRAGRRRRSASPPERHPSPQA